MRKFLLISCLVVVAVGIAGWLCWVGRARVAAHYLSKEFHVPAKVGSLEISTGAAQISHLVLGNPKGSRTPISFACDKTDIATTFRKLMGNPLVVEEIVMENIFVGLEYYNQSGQDNNWEILLHRDANSKKAPRDYIIRKVILINLTVQRTMPNGKVETFPTIPRLEFTNITSETGFPVGDIEKAIFNLMMQNIFRKLGLDQLLNTIVPGNSPLKYVPLFK